MAASFNIGDIVQLKSGGPKMTVISGLSSGNLWCSWFAGAKAERALFPVAALQVPASNEAKKSD